jgi:CRISPR-associated protein Csx14
MKTYLLTICGSKPQVITETLYALHQQGIQVDAIRILTTRAGKDACIGQLLRDGDGEYHRYLSEYGHSHHRIDFSARHVKAVLNEDGTEIDDIDTEEENERFLQLCMDDAFDLTSDPQNRVLFSIAGGRRTMGTCLSLAAQCYARPHDRIYHVLLNPSEFESCRDFFYPPRQPRIIEVRNRQGQPCMMETSLAEITLVPMPFFPLRGHLTQQMLRQPESPAALMLSLIRETKHELVVDLVQRKIVWKGIELDLSAARLALYTLLAQAKKDGACNRSTCQECESCYLTFEQISGRQEELTRLYQRISTREIGKSGIVNLDSLEFNSYRSKINKEIALCFGEYEARKLQIESFGARPGVRYGLRLNKERILIVS